MLLIDNILLFPVTGIGWICREIHHAARQELAHEADAITAKLSDLYLMIETGEITEAEFDARERALLDRLDQLQGQSLEAAKDFEDDDAHGRINALHPGSGEEEHGSLRLSRAS
jgi:hypothetical protein